jgi:dienelactone hydrolase
MVCHRRPGLTHPLISAWCFRSEADHAFANDARPDLYNPEAARLAWERTLDFLHKHLD